MNNAIFHPNMKMKDYLDNDGYLSGSMLSTILNRPDLFKYKYIDGNDEESLSHLKLGTLTHTLFLEPYKFKEEYHVIPDTYIREKDGAVMPWREDERMQVVKNDIEKADGKIRITSKQLSEAETYVHALQDDTFATYYDDLEKIVEASILYKGHIINLKSRPDIIYPRVDVIDNIKTADCAKPEIFFKKAINFGYDISAALAAYCYEKAFERKLQDYRFVVVEKSVTTPVMVFNTNLPMFGDKSMTFLEFGAKRLKKAIRQYLWCMDNNRWDPYFDMQEKNMVKMEVPYWEYAKYE